MAGATAADERELRAALEGFNNRNVSKQLEAGRALSDSSHPRAEALFDALIAGQIYRRKADDTLLIVSGREGRQYQVADPVSGEPLANVNRRSVARLPVSNRLRTALRTLRAQRGLLAADVAVRRAAARRLLEQPDRSLRELVQSRIDSEPDGTTLRRLQLLLMVLNIRSESVEQALAAIAKASSSLHPSVSTALAEVVAGGREVALTRAAQGALADIELRRQRLGYLQTLLFGLSLGSVLALAAIGLTITFGQMGVINMAHGELIMLGAYTTWLVQTALPPGMIEVSIVLALPAAFLVAALAGWLIERGVVRHLYGRPLETLLATFGLSLILQQAARAIFGPLNQSVTTPNWLSGSLQIMEGFELGLTRFYILLFTLLVFFSVRALLSHTRLGLEARATTQDRQMARAMGIDTGRVDSLTFALGSGLAGLAGVALALVANVGPNLGQNYIIDSFMVVVFGGVGNLWGTLTAGLSIGVLNKFLEPAAGAVGAKILVLLAIIVFIQRRPQGLFPPRGRSVSP